MWPYLLIHNFETGIFIRMFRMPKVELSRSSRFWKHQAKGYKEFKLNKKL